MTPIRRWHGRRGAPPRGWCRAGNGLPPHELVLELGRGDKDLKRSLSRALLRLGDDAVARSMRRRPGTGTRRRAFMPARASG